LTRRTRLPSARVYISPSAKTVSFVILSSSDEDLDRADSPRDFRTFLPTFDVTSPFPTNEVMESTALTRFTSLEPQSRVFACLFRSRYISKTK
jgi:hypothetical protein